MDLNVRWHLYLGDHLKKYILVINLVWVIKVCLQLEIQNNFQRNYPSLKVHSWIQLVEYVFFSRAE